RALQITRKALLGLDQRNLFLQRTRDVTQLHILDRLDAEQHLRYEPSERLGQALTEFRGELRQLRFESGSDFAIVHGGRLLVVWISRKDPSTTDFVPSHFPIPANDCFFRGWALVF